MALHGLGAGTATTAYFFVFAVTTLAIIDIWIAQVFEFLRIFPNFREWSLAHLTGVEFKVATGLDLSTMGNEAEPHAAETAARHGIKAEVLEVDRCAVFLGTLAQDAVVMRGASRLELHVSGLAEIIEPVEYVFVFFACDHFGAELNGPSGGYQQEYVPCRCSEVFAQVKDVLEQMEIVLGDGGVDLEFDTHVFQILNAAHGSVECTEFATELIVLDGFGRVDGDGTPFDTCVFHLLRGFRRDQRAVGGHDTTESLGFGIGDQFVHIGAHHGFAAGENDDRVAHVRKCVDECLGFDCGQLAFIRLGMCLGAAMLAGEIGGAGHFSCDQ